VVEKQLFLSPVLALSFNNVISLDSHDLATRVADLEAHIHSKPPTSIILARGRSDVESSFPLRAPVRFPPCQTHQTPGTGEAQHCQRRPQIAISHMRIVLFAITPQIPPCIRASAPRSHPPLSTCTRAVTFRSLDRPPTRPSGTPAPRYCSEK
jgi:hypothetical protein